ncbi:hypothetical protein QYE76_048793 [Lolium multiflorum]|uniref:Reverse transcriptase domain-containing protein n=1 Tax=Lolium multiflorum TaxID=4521 RepID=A0AAD8SN15_LOLMU|nr:hypothetical protein QYE76_048793 [Lolium multiflorum]
MEYLDKFVVVYLDDILVYSKSNEEHEEHLRLALLKLREHRLYAKLSKCEFWLPQVVYLGHVISGKGIAINPKTVKAIVEWLPPKNVKQVRSFLGLASYCCRFIENFSKIAKLLTDLLKKDKKFVWSPQCQESLDLLKQKLTSTPLLVLPDTSKPFQIFCDASLHGLGDFLMQERQVVAYASRQLCKHELNYPTHDLELATLIHALLTWRQYLLGNRCEAFTDHKSLKYIFSQPNLNLRQMRWLETIKDFDLSITYTPGKANVMADTLSRKSYCNNLMIQESQPALCEEFRKFNLELVPKGYLANLVITQTLEDKIRTGQLRDDDGGSQKEEPGGARVGPHPRAAARPRRHVVWRAHDLFASFFAKSFVPKPKPQRVPHEELQPPLGRRTPERKELRRVGIGEIPPGGEIDAIVTDIELDIIIISTIITAVITAGHLNPSSKLLVLLLVGIDILTYRRYYDTPLYLWVIKTIFGAVAGSEALLVNCSKLTEFEEERLLQILKKHRGAIGYTLDDLKGISPSICQHAINMEDDAKPVVEPRLIPKMKEVVRNEVLRLLEAGIIYPIAIVDGLVLCIAFPRKESRSTMVSKNKGKEFPDEEDRDLGWKEEDKDVKEEDEEEVEEDSRAHPRATIASIKMTEEARRRSQRSRWAHTLGGAAQCPGRHVCGGPTTLFASFSSRNPSSRKPKPRGYLTKSYSRLCGAENTREKRALRRVGIRRGNSLREGEIDAIVTDIELDIIIISTIITAVITAGHRHRRSNLGLILIV